MSANRFVRLWLLAAIAAALAASGCQVGRKQPMPFQPRHPLVYVEHFPGEPLSGATARAISIARPEDALDIRVSIVALERMPGGAGRPIGTAARLLVATRGLEPVRPSARLTGGVRLIASAPGGDWSMQGDFGRTVLLREASGALPEGATFRVAVSTGGGLWEFMVCRLPGGAAIQVAIVNQAAYRPAAEPVEESGPSTRPSPPATVVQKPAVLVREIAILEQPVVPTPDQVCVLVPMSVSEAPAQGLAVAFDIRPGSDAAEHVQAVAAAQEDLKRAASRSEVRPDRLAVGSSSGSLLQTAIRSLADDSSRRAALVFLAGQTGAMLCENTAMIADEDLLARLARVVSSRGEELWLTPDSLGWQMERAAFELHAELLLAGKLPPELAAVLVSYAGEAGRNPASIEELGKFLGARAEFDARLVAENLIYLEDSSPGSRVRAYDWLTSRGRAPAGYDPLGSPRERRDALEKSLHPATANVPGGGQP